MIVGIVNYSNFKGKFIEALNNAQDRHESAITFLVDERTEKLVHEFFVSQKNVDVCKLGKSNHIYLVKHMRIDLEILDYYV